MDSMKFGQFLFREGLVTYDDILQAKLFQTKGSAKLGLLGIRLGLLTESQVERILAEQDESGLAFGQIAIREHFLNEEQVDSILCRQKDSSLDFSEALIAVGALTPEIRDNTIEKYEAFKPTFGRRKDDCWYRIVFQGRRIEIDDEGFLRNIEDWSEDLARYIAEKDNIQLDERHWEVIGFIRKFYQEYRTSPMPNVVLKALNTQAGAEVYTIKSLCTLFNGSSIRKACQVAGIPKPPGCT